MNPALFVFGVVAIGFASGLRAFTPLALVCWVAVWGWMPLGGSRLAFLGTIVGAAVVSLLALAELIGDKLPFTPSRLTPGPLGGRMVTSALAAAAVSLGAGQSWILGVICALTGCMGGAFAGFHIRRTIVRRLGVTDWIVALAEDLVTFGLVLLVMALLF